MRAPAALALACLLLLAGCSYGYAGPTTTAGPESPAATESTAPGTAPSETTPPGTAGESPESPRTEPATAAPPTSSPSSTPSPSPTPSEVPTPSTSPTPEDAGRIRVVGGSLPVDEVLVYRRTLRLLGTDVEGPERIEIRDLSALSAEGAERREFFRLVGLVRDARPNDTDVGVAAYVAEPDVVNVNRRALDRPTRLEYTLAHEYVHVVQFRTGAVTGARLATDATLDGRIAWRAAIEGAATYVEDSYWREYGREGTRPVVSVRGLYENASGSGRFAVAPYRFGAAYADERVASPANLSVVYRDPPSTTEQVLHPGVMEEPADLSTVAADGADWLAVPGERRMGELFVRVALSTGVDADAARRGAHGWGTDRRLDFVGPGGRRGYAWVLRWDDERNATEFASVTTDWLDARAERTGDVWRRGNATYRLERVDDRTVVLYAGASGFVRGATAVRRNGTVVVRPTG